MTETTLQQLGALAKTRLRDISDAPEREVQWLIEHVTGLNASAQHRHREQALGTAQTQRLMELLSRREHGEPLAYVLGTQPFWTLELAVTPAVLIPRPETELLVERALRHLPDNTAASVADLGTGSGAIALALAHERPLLEVWATDISPPALAMAERNASHLQLHQIHFQHGSWCAALGKHRFQVIVSNPPYIAEGDPHLQPAVLAHEPRVALLAGADGLDALREIIQHAPEHLHTGGWLALEHGWQQAPAVQALLESAGFVSVASHADLAGHLRVTEGQWPT